MIWCIGMMMKALNMGFLKNVLSSKQKEEEIGIRAAHKDYNYFLNQLNRNEKVIEKLTNNLDDMVIQDTITPFNYWSISVKYLVLTMM